MYGKQLCVKWLINKLGWQFAGCQLPVAGYSGTGYRFQVAGDYTLLGGIE